MISSFIDWFVLSKDTGIVSRQVHADLFAKQKLRQAEIIRSQ